NEIKSADIEIADNVFSLTFAPIIEKDFVNVYGLDISERKLAVEVLSLERDFAEGILNTAQAIILVLDKQGRIVQFNHYMEEISGYTLGEVKGKDWFRTFLPEVDHSKIRTLFQKSIADIKIKGNVNSIIMKNGSERQIEWYDNTLKDSDGNVIGLLSIGQDITERKQAEKALKESENNFRILVDNTSDFIYSFDKESRHTAVNKSTCNAMGLSEDQIIGKNHYELGFPEDIVKEWQVLHKKVFSKKKIVEEETVTVMPDGKVYTYQVILIPVFDDNGDVICIRGSSRDITERKQAEKLIKESHEDFRNLTIYTATKIEEEKKKIARGIHDGLGQLLTAIKIQLTLLGKNIPDVQNNIENIDSMKSMIDSGIQTIQDITKELRPVVLDDLGLVAALQTRLADFEESSGIKTNFICQPQHFTLDSDLSLSIYRIFLEIFTNIIRHSKTKKVSMKLRKYKTTISLTVRDYGTGITEEQISDSLSFGLIGIRERLNIWNGKMEIKGVPGKGTTIKIRIPVSNEM
ncbi:MAG: PAS domain S-box protein, partial [Candidatus Cloacimonetes bacterium]|nr:PAS domain S-box protein [Candidatus Cloacimonadota bacterium]